MVNRKRIFGWMCFDWASQPYNTLLITFIFGPYIKELVGDGSSAQSYWSIGIALAGVIIAIFSPILGAVADIGGTRLRWIWVFSALYVFGSVGLWSAAPDNFNLVLTLFLFAVGIIGMEFATTFTNSFLSDLGPREDIGRISANGWAFGYLGGFVALLITLLFFAERPETGKTLIGLAPAFGLDAEAREGTRAVGPLTAIWYIVFIIPFFLYVRDPRPVKAPAGAVKAALSTVWDTIKGLPKRPSLTAHLVSSMFYRDALNAIYAIGGIYAAGMLGWGAVDTGTFGVIAIVSGTLFTWLSGRVDARFGAKSVIATTTVILIFVTIAIATTTRYSVLGFLVAEGSRTPDYVFYFLGALIGAAGGTLQAASRALMVFQADKDRMTEGFGLYALTGKATSFLAPFLIFLFTWSSGSQQIGITPVIGMFIIGLVVLYWVSPEGDVVQK